MRRFVLGTAGHIDHGKTALIRALTGTDTDRLPEEKRRGISIDLGFAHLQLDEDTVLSIVDVPGHERFIKNMVAGATGVDGVLLVIAADEGVMPQTREHLDIMTLLGVRRGFVVLTKIDLVDDEWLAMVSEEIKGELDGTFLADSPLIGASAVTGVGVDEVRSQLHRLVSGADGRDRDGLARLPIDRVFTVRGFGTVVTGTLAAGRLAVGDRLELSPVGEPVRVRQLEVHGRTVSEAEAGERVAVNLGGIDRDDIVRGQVLIVPGFACVAHRISARLKILSGARTALVSNARVRLHIGTAEVMARVIPLDRDRLDPGEDGLVRFNLERPTVAFWRDRFIIRSYSPQDTVGGGLVLETERRRRRRDEAGLRALVERERANLERYVDLVLSDEMSRPVTSDEVPLAVGYVGGRVRPIVDKMVSGGSLLALDGDLYLHRAAYERAGQAIRERLARHAEEEPLSAGLPRERLRQETHPNVSARAFGALLALLAADGVVGLDKAMVTQAGRQVRLDSRQERLREQLEGAALEAGFSPPTLAELCEQVPGREARAIVDYLMSSGALIRIGEGLIVHVRNLARAQRMITSRLEEAGELTVAELRDLLGTSRKYVLALLGYFDDAGVTRRRGDQRVRGPNTLQFAEDDRDR